MKKALFVFAALVTITAFPLFTQEEDIPDYTEQEVPAEADLFFPDNDQLYVITDFEFEIKGRTRPDAILNLRSKSGKKEFQEGEEVWGREGLEQYAANKTQVLINQRVLKDNTAIDFSIGEQQEDGSWPVTVIIKVEDSWNIIALPRPSYSTNTGFDLTVKARDYNFLGTMNPLRVDLGYQYDENKRNSFLLLIDSNTPFTAFGYTWNIDFDNLFGYRPQVDEPFYYQNTSGLSVEIPFRTTIFTFGFQESINLNEENSNRYKEQYGDFQNGLYMSTELYALWKIPTGLMIADYGELTYNTGLSATFNHEFPDWTLHEFRKGPFMGFSHSLGFEKIDWHANYRKGFSVSVNNSYTYDFFRMTKEREPLSLSFTISGTGHFLLSKFFGISSRLQYRYWFYHDPDFYDQAGDVIRGITDKDICTDNMLSLNMDFPFRILLFTPSEWLHKSKLRFFDFELQASPIIDMALYHDPKKKKAFHPENMAVTGGAELIAFPSFMRSLYIRLGYACNLRELFSTPLFKLSGSESREIYLMMGHFY
jgi:hypothetical protein